MSHSAVVRGGAESGCPWGPMSPLSAFCSVLKPNTDKSVVALWTLLEQMEPDWKWQFPCPCGLLKPPSPRSEEVGGTILAMVSGERWEPSWVQRPFGAMWPRYSHGPCRASELCALEELQKARHWELPKSQGYGRDGDSIYYSALCRTCSIGENIMLPPSPMVEQCYLSEHLRRENHSGTPIIKISCNNVISLFLLPQSIAFICMKEGRFMKCALHSALLHISNSFQIFLIRLDQVAII